jgi:hypothetical protein
MTCILVRLIKSFQTSLNLEKKFGIKGWKISPNKIIPNILVHLNQRRTNGKSQLNPVQVPHVATKPSLEALSFSSIFHARKSGRK